MEPGDSKTISKKAAKKEAAKQRRRSNQAAALATIAASSLAIKEEQDPLACNYGYEPMLKGEKESTPVGELMEDLKNKEVRISGRAETIRAVGKNTFVVVRESGFTIQCVVTVQPELVSRQMVKYVAGLSRESLIDVQGIVFVPSVPIKGTTQQVEIQVRKLYCVSKAMPTLPLNPEVAAATSEKETEEALQARISSVAKQQKFIIPNKYGEKLVGVLHDTGSKEIIVLCHGFASTKENKTLMNLAVALENEGISAFRFDFSGNGESEGSLSYSNFWKEADDIRAVIEHFNEAERITSVILGHSKGGSVALLYASKYHDINAVVNLSGRFDPSKGIEEKLGKDFMEKMKQEGFVDVKNKKGTTIYRETEKSLMDGLNANMQKACLQIDKECRVFTVHGSPIKSFFWKMHMSLQKSYQITNYTSLKELIMATLHTKLSYHLLF